MYNRQQVSATVSQEQLLLNDPSVVKTSQGLLNRNAGGRFNSEVKYSGAAETSSYQSTPIKQRNYNEGLKRMNPTDNTNYLSPESQQQRNLQFTLNRSAQNESGLSNQKNSQDMSLEDQSKFRTYAQMKLNPQSDQALNQKSFMNQNHTPKDEYNIAENSNDGLQGVSFNRFKNTAFVGLTTQSVRRSLNEMTQQIKKSKEIHDLMVERQNIENMIVNSKLWSPRGSQVRGPISSGTVMSTNETSQYTSNVFGDKRDELTKILKKRLNYIHQQSAINQHMVANQMNGTFNGSGPLSSPKNQRLGSHYPLSNSPGQTGAFKKSNNVSLVPTPKVTKNHTKTNRRLGGGLFRGQKLDMNESVSKTQNPNGLGLEIPSDDQRLPEISLNKAKQNNALVPGKGGNPFMNRNRDGSLDKKPVHHYNPNQQQRSLPTFQTPLPELDKSSHTLGQQPTHQESTTIQTQLNQLSQQQQSNNLFDFSLQSSIEPLASHVDAVIMDNSFKRQMKEQLNNSVNAKAKVGNHQVSYNESNKDNNRARDNTSLKRQMIYQNDIQIKMGQINRVMDEEFETLDNAMEYLKLKKPHELGLDFQGMSSSPKGNKMKKGHHANQSLAGIESVMKSDSLNYMSMIKSSKDMIDHQGMDPLNDSHLHDLIQEEQIRNFAMMLMRQRKMLGFENSLERHQSFDTQLGMAFSAGNDYGELKNSGNESSSGSENEDGDGHRRTKHDDHSPSKNHHHIQVTETEKQLKAKELEFVHTIQDNIIREFEITGTAETPKTPIESLYILQKKKQRQKQNIDDVHPQVEVYMKQMKETTIDALTQDVKARTGFFEFIKQNQSTVFVEKFLKDPKLNYFFECNKELVTALPVVSKIQNKSLVLFGYRLNSGVCKALGTYLTNFKNCLNKISLDNNDLNTGDNLQLLMQGVHSQDMMKQIIIIRNTVDDQSVELLSQIMERPMPRNLDELRIINSKITPVSIQKILTTIECGNSHIRRLALAGVGLNEQGLDLLAEIVDHVRSLIDLDISWNGLRPNNHLKKFFEALGQNRSIQYLNLSWNNLMLPPSLHSKDLHNQERKQTAPMINVNTAVANQDDLENEEIGSQKDPLGQTQVQSDTAMHTTTVNNMNATHTKKEKLDDYTQHLLDNLLRIIKYNNHLIHLDLSYTRLDENMIIKLGTALRRAKSLVAVHFTGNPGVTQKSTEYLQDRVHCRPYKDRDLKQEGQTLIQNLYSEAPLQHKAFEGIQLKQITQKQKFIRTVQGGQSFKPSEGGNGGFQLEFQRWLGHKFEIPMSGQWQMNSAWQDIKDQCWVCSKWCYTLIYWSPQVQTQIYKTFGSKGELKVDQDQVRQVRSLVRAKPSQLQQNRIPFIAGSFTNWEAREMIPVLEFCEAVDLNKTDPIQMLKKQGRIGPEIEREEDLKTEKEKAHLARIKESIKNDYKFRWQQCIQKSTKYKKAQHVNLDFAAEVDIRREEIYVFAVFGPPGQHLYYVGNPQMGIEHVNKCIVNLREEDIPIVEKINRFKVNQRVFKKDASVFKDWKEDTSTMLADMFADDSRWWKCSRFIKDENDRERVTKIVQTNYIILKKIFSGLTSSSTFPNIGQIDIGNFCVKCGIVDGKSMALTDIDRCFIAANVTIEGQKLSEENPSNALTRFEYFEFLIRVAHFKYVTGGQCKTVEDAFNRLLNEHIFPNAHPPAWQEFRDELLWTIEVNDVLEANIQGIQKIYNYYQEPRKKFMTQIDAMNLMIRDTQVGIGEKEATFCYGMSKMSVVLEQENMGQYRILKFVELLEMIGRIAHFKFKDNPDLNDAMPLSQKIEHVLDILLKLVGVPRKDVTLNIVEESESDDDY